MKKTILLFMILVFHVSYSQTNVDQLLELGIENAQRFSTDYFAPAGEALVNSMSNGWYKTAKVKKLWRFEVGFIGNLSFVREEKQSFILNTAEYDGIEFREGPPSQAVANAFGGNQGDIVVVLNQGQLAQVEITLPDGIGGKEVNIAPTGFLQASMGVSRSTEVKARFLPKIAIRENTEVFLYGLAVQHELTDWIFSWKRLPFRVSGLIGYTSVRGFYDFTADSEIDGEDQEIRLKSNSWLVSGIISTKLPKFNFYGGFGYYGGNSTADILGTYRVQNGPLASQTLEDPISVDNKTSGLKATIGANVKLGFFRANLDYTLQNYQNLSIGLNFGW
ncbi:hypothetical protein D1818_08860 [Aquimarina sp. BL5]|uniref:DUF6588 family protein n=1 Tax=Aquimarina sp. BL5 TaxID=1714860 RepID=UPI000E4E42AE|nr:DUF6588 family protein [Aquimarina sp. BL5]AXT50929.1 hypothetical protein D1818_08860 [Aquimarina sp. BL5]RKM98702.1 hypothetical protein D7036_19850 [Aquimarina sp. BL5]